MKAKSQYAALTSAQTAVLLVSILIVALCGIAYQLIISSVSSYLLGNSVYQFSITIGLFMFAMGVGSYLSKWLTGSLLTNFIAIEVVISLVGGACSLVLMMVFPQVRALYELVMFGFIFVIGVLVGMEIPLLTTILTEKEKVRDSIAHVLSLDYLGALFGSLLFPLVLLPHLGLIRSSFAVGLLSVLTALVNIAYFKAYLPRPRLWFAATLSVLLALVVLLVYGSTLTRYAEQHLYADEIIYSEQTPYQYVVMTRANGSRDTRLYIDGHIQFSSQDEYRYHEALVHPVMTVEGPKQSVLILGGGDGLAVREVLKYAEVTSIDLVDIDPAITRLASELPQLKKLNAGSLQSDLLTVHHEDAFNFIRRTDKRYDRVIIDLPDPHNEALNKLYAREFYRLIQAKMNPNAVLVSQSSSPFFTRRTFWGIETTMAAVFDHTQSYHIAIPSFGEWGFHLASSQQALPQHYAILADTQFLDSAVMDAAQHFGKDMAKLSVPVNSMLEPKLYQLYLDDLKSRP